MQFQLAVVSPEQALARASPVLPRQAAALRLRLGSSRRAWWPFHQYQPPAAAPATSTTPIRLRIATSNFGEVPDVGEGPR